VSALGRGESSATLCVRPVPAGFVLPEVIGCRADVPGIFAAMAAKGEFRLPLPGAGSTRERFAALAEISAVDLSLGRLVEGHTDAVAILAGAGREPPPGSVLGVWAARRADMDVTATATATGQEWRLRGAKPWASGAGLLTHALVTAATDKGDCLFEVALDRFGTRPVPGTWPAVGMAQSGSLDVEFDIVVGDDCRLGPPGWYVDRPGFWFGSVGVAACWLGGALGLVRSLASDLAGRRDPDAHQWAHLGAVAARCASMARDVDWAAGLIDADPAGPDRRMRPVAIEVRDLVENGCLDVLAQVGRAGGAGPLCQDPAQARRFADLPVYVRQHHAERDREALGRSLIPRVDSP